MTGDQLYNPRVGAGAQETIAERIPAGLKAAAFYSKAKTILQTSAVHGIAPYDLKNFASFREPKRSTLAMTEVVKQSSTQNRIYTCIHLHQFKRKPYAQTGQILIVTQILIMRCTPFTENQFRPQCNHVALRSFQVVNFRHLGSQCTECWISWLKWAAVSKNQVAPTNVSFLRNNLNLTT